MGDYLGVPVIVEEGLKEYNIGQITGLTWHQVVDQHPAVAERWDRAEPLAIDGEEGRESFRARVVATFDAITLRHTKDKVGVVSHGGTIGTYLVHLLGLSSNFSPFRFDNGSLSIIQPDPVRPRILLLNDTCHLQGDR